ncbi:MAG: SGNH/GDSL hydrolase family protein [Prevotella sp.]|nr:SGNH/GDSL hydrolase family protein [Prevotella sp.]
MKKLLLLILGCVLALTATAQPTSLRGVTGRHWVGTWATAIQPVVKSFMPYNNCMTNRSVRQVVKVSIGGNVVRLKISNELSTEPLVIRSVYIAPALEGAAIVPKEARYLQFGKKYKVTIPAGKAVWSDALSFPLKALSRLAITINYTKAPVVPTVHMGSRTTSYIVKGCTNAHSSFAKAFREEHWFNIAALDVYDFQASAVAIIGNSITDGKNSTDNAQNRWPDILSETLQKKYKKTDLGILNLGIGNNRVATTGGFGYPAKTRFDHNILEQSGVSAVVIFEGINDIGNARTGESEAVAQLLIRSYEEMIKKAREHHLKVYLGTITPMKGCGVYYNLFHEAAREQVNEWIRKQRGRVDGILDFDELLRDREEPHQLKREYQSDWLHPNPEGYRVMGEYAASVLK